MARFPLALELSGRSTLVVGLGQVGCRKAMGLLDAGAKVLGVDPRGWNAPDRPTAGIEVRAEPYRAEHLEGIALAIASASKEVNRQVVEDANARGIWVNSATDPDEGNMTLPAVWRQGPITLAVWTEGASPALAITLRDRAAEALGPAASGLASLLNELRPLALAHVSDPDARRRLLQEWADPKWLERWASDGPEAVRAALFQSLRNWQAQ